MLDLDSTKRLPQQPVASALGTEPTAEEVATAPKAMVNVKAVRPDDLPVELLKLRLQQDRTILLEFHRFATLNESHNSGKTWSLPYSIRKMSRRGVETTKVSHSCLTRVALLL